ncbi:hypothetical protein ZIOFF_074695 [Zingiber officinale]|uniref:Polyprotein n=1 Tax=Zingiber officinale TaxID=94328 RepID=A0A8J5ERZ8_ZINOF|nr:hypothetical protein ZIOFF_075665 [Zingiber officinale]KAG6467504.1 hypothetical protein ZIOFF_074695 [Zingiber officinale]
MLSICEEHGLVLSPSKCKIGEGKLKLHPHIIKKITEFKDMQLKEKKGLRLWLGILNYARTYIPNLSSKLGPLYEKTSPHGDKRMKNSDWALVKEIKAQVNNLPDLEIPPENAYIDMETDGSMTGWGGVCKWKPNRYDPRNMEKVCAYANGKFPVVKSVIDAEIYVAMETMTALKIHYMDKLEITLRTDCQAIISFNNKTSRNKPSRVHWLAFTDYITSTRVKVNFEHIDGKLNILTDMLSKLVEEPKTLAVIIEEGEVAFGPPTLTDAEEEAACSSRFPLLTEYEDLISDTFSKNFLKEEHEKRNG